MGEMDIINVVETSPASSEDEMEPGKEIQQQKYKTRLAYSIKHLMFWVENDKDPQEIDFTFYEEGETKYKGNLGPGGDIGCFGRILK